MRGPWMLVVVALAAACSSSDGGGGGGGATASGVAIKGPLTDGTVTVFAVRATGALGNTLGEGTTDASGAFAVSVGGTPGLAVATITGGSFVDEATGATVALQGDDALIGFVDSADGALDHAITPASTIAFSLMQNFAHDPEATLQDNIENALSATEDLFGLTDIDVVAPADLTAGSAVAGAAFDHGAFNAGLSALAADLGVPTLAVVNALARDARDGRLDGAEFGAALTLGGGPMPPTTGTTDLAAAVGAFLASPSNASGLTAADTQVDDELAASTGAFAQPIQVRALVDGYGTVSAPVAAELEASSFLPPGTQVLLEGQLLQVTAVGNELGFDVPAGLPLGLHDLVVRDADTGLATRMRDAIEVFDSSALPTIGATAPPAGPLTGGTFLRIEGTNLGPETVVEIDGTPAVVLAHDFPRSLVVATPAHAAGAVAVTVRNGLLDAVRANAFEYRAGDTRANPALPANATPIVFAAFRMLLDDDDGFTAQTLTGRSTFSAAETGSFDLEDRKATELAPAIATRDRDGSTFRANESLGKALLFFDQTNGISDFVRGFTNEENGVSLGVTAFGPALFFPEPTGAHVSSVARAYWANGIETNVGEGTVRQNAGWIELDDELGGSASFLVHGRDLAGTASELAFEKWTIEYNLQTDGFVNLQRSVDGEVQLLTGRFSEGGEIGFLSFGSKGGTLGFYLLTPVQHGVELGAFGGWAGGSLQHELQDDGSGGLESAFESGPTRELFSSTAAHAGRLAFRRASRRAESDAESSFQERVGATLVDVTPSGRILAEGDSELVGYVAASDGLLLTLGAFPNEATLAEDPDDPIGIGGAVFRDSRKSILSLEPQRKQIAIEAKLFEDGTTHRHEVGTDFFDIALALAPPVVDGVPIAFAGSIPQLASTTLTGTAKSTVRDEEGAVETTAGVPEAWGVSTGFSVIDDTLDLFATEVTQPGRFTGAPMPRWLGSGTFGNDGETAVLRTSDEFLGDGLIYWISDLGTELVEPNFPVNVVGLTYDPDAALSDAISSFYALEFGGNGTLAAGIETLAQSEDGSFVHAVGAGLGEVAVNGQEMRLTIPRQDGGEPDFEWQTIWTPSGDAFVGIDDSPEFDGAAIVVATRPVNGAFGDDDRSWIGLTLDLVASRATTEQLFLAPRSGALLTGERFTSSRAAETTLIGGQSFAAVGVTETGAGEARVQFINQIPALRFFFNTRDEAVGQPDLLLQVTPRIVQSLDE